MKTLLSWSSGKDAAWALHLLRRNSDIEVVGLFTTVNEEFGRVAMHGVRGSVLEAQARAAGLPLHVIDLPWPCPNEAYEERMGGFVEAVRAEGVQAMAFGDLFLEDIRAYREARLEGTGVAPLFPVWRTPTGRLSGEMVAGGLEARVTCVDPRQLDASFAGRAYDAQFLADLPEGVDPCGEHGEFHTCVHAGPMFAAPFDLAVGEIVERDGFVFADVMVKG